MKTIDVMSISGKTGTKLRKILIYVRNLIVCDCKFNLTLSPIPRCMIKDAMINAVVICDKPIAKNQSPL